MHSDTTKMRHRNIEETPGCFETGRRGYQDSHQATQASVLGRLRKAHNPEAPGNANWSGKATLRIPIVLLKTCMNTIDCELFDKDGCVGLEVMRGWPVLSLVLSLIEIARKRACLSSRYITFFHFLKSNGQL